MALTSQQLQQLQTFANAGDRVNYWTYLGSYLTQQGMDRRYADLALGVVLDNTPAGKLANDFLAYSAQ